MVDLRFSEEMNDDKQFVKKIYFYIFCDFRKKESCRYKREAENQLNQLQVENILWGRDFTWICSIFKITIYFTTAI